MDELGLLRQDPVTERYSIRLKAVQLGRFAGSSCSRSHRLPTLDSDGMVASPDRPGLGVSLNQATVDRHQVA